MNIRPVTSDDEEAVWAILAPMIRAGETYPLPVDMGRAEALGYWFAAAHTVFVAENDGRIVGTYYLRANQSGGGSHVANCGYVAAPDAGGLGVGRSMCEHSIAHARAKGFRAMQFNFVVATNQRAVQLWGRCGFEVVGRLPSAFHHPTRGFVDALVMFRTI